MTHIHDRYIIRAIPVQGFSSFQTACLHGHIVSPSGRTAGCVINTKVYLLLRSVILSVQYTAFRVCVQFHGEIEPELFSIALQERNFTWLLRNPIRWDYPSWIWVMTFVFVFVDLTAFLRFIKTVCFFFVFFFLSKTAFAPKDHY